MVPGSQIDCDISLLASQHTVIKVEQLHRHGNVIWEWLQCLGQHHNGPIDKKSNPHSSGQVQADTPPQGVRLT